MLTEAQQKLKHELEELRVKSLLHEHSEAKLFPVSVQPKTKWPVLLLTILVLSFAACCLALTLTKPSQQNIGSFLTKELDYNRKSAKLLDNVIEAHTLDPQQAKKEQLQLQEKAKKLSVPTGFKEHKEDFLSLLEQRHMILTYLAESSTIDSSPLNRYLIELEVKQELAHDSLIKALNKQNIPRHIRDDGSIQYQLDQDSYEFNLK